MKKREMKLSWNELSMLVTKRADTLGNTIESIRENEIASNTDSLCGELEDVIGAIREKVTENRHRAKLRI